jgi:hypothetical protein
LIRHAGLFLPASLPVLALTIAVIEPPFLALLVSLIGPPALPPPRIVPTGVAAVAMSPITVRTDEEDRLALRMHARSLKENRLAVSLRRRHALSQARLDWTTAPDSWQVRTVSVWF